MEELKLQREQLQASREEFSRQNQALADQLQMMQESIEKLRGDSELHLRYKGRGSEGTKEYLHFINRGGEIRDIKIEKLAGPAALRLSLDRDVVAHEGIVILSLDWGASPFAMEPHPEFDFRLTYVDRLGRANSKSYRLPSGVGGGGFEELVTQRAE